MHSSATWTSDSGDMGVLSDTDEVADRAQFVEEYNRLANKACRCLQEKKEIRSQARADYPP